MLSFGIHPQWQHGPLLEGIAYVFSILSSLESGKWIAYVIKAYLLCDVYFVCRRYIYHIQRKTLHESIIYHTIGTYTIDFLHVFLVYMGLTSWSPMHVIWNSNEESTMGVGPLIDMRGIGNVT